MLKFIFIIPKILNQSRRPQAMLEMAKLFCINCGRVRSEGGNDYY
jgi:hypothetical protein